MRCPSDALTNGWAPGLFTPRPSGLEEYCRHGPGGRAGARLPELVAPIYLEPLDGFSPFEVLWNCLAL